MTEFIPNKKIKINDNKIKKDINIPQNENINVDNKDQNKDKENDSINKNKNKIKPKNINYKLEIELSDAYYGARKKIKLNRNRICKTCRDKNILDMVNINCEECGGKKYFKVKQIIKEKYIGQLINGKREGRGIIKWDNGDIYNGEWKDDKK